MKWFWNKKNSLKAYSSLLLARQERCLFLPFHTLIKVPGSIVNETLKNGILMLKDTSKELHFHADFKYISLIKFSHCHQKLRA